MDHSIFNMHIYLADQSRYLYSQWCQSQSLPYIHMVILDYIARFESSAGAGKLCEMGTIAANLAIPNQTLTSQVDALEKKGYLQRRRDPQNRRKVCVQSEDKGRELISDLLNKLEIIETKVMESIPADEFDTFNIVYQRIIVNLNKHLQ